MQHHRILGAHRTTALGKGAWILIGSLVVTVTLMMMVMGLTPPTTPRLTFVLITIIPSSRGMDSSHGVSPHHAGIAICPFRCKTFPGRSGRDCKFSRLLDHRY